MRIAFVGNPALVHIKRWVREFVARGHTCQLYAPDGADVAAMVAMDAIPIGVAGREGPASTARRVLDLRAHLARFSPDVLHAHYALDYGTWAALSGFRPLVITCMGSDLLVAPGLSIKSRLKVGLALRAATLVTVNAGHLGSAAVRLGASSERVVRVVQGVDPDLFRPPSEARSSGPRVILSTRHFHPIYRLHDLLGAAARLASQGVEFRLHLAGEGPEEARLKAMCRRLHLEEMVTFLGVLDGDRALADAYGGSDIYVSVSASDGASVALLEAMACGLPVVASDIPASREWLAPGSGNILVRVGDEAQIADGIARMLARSRLRTRAGERNRRLVLRRASWSAEMDRMEALYRELAAGRS